MKHSTKKRNPKRELARKLVTPKDREHARHLGRLDVFDTPGWNNRKDAIAARVEKRTNRARIRRKEREAARKAGKPVVYSIK